MALPLFVRRVFEPFQRHHFFQPSFQARVFVVLCCALRQRTTLPSSTAALASLPTDLLHVILAASAGEGDSRRDGYDDMAAVESGCQHLFLPAPGSAGVREALFDGVFGL